jgi:hypothetical protein
LKDLGGKVIRRFQYTAIDDATRFSVGRHRWTDPMAPSQGGRESEPPSEPLSARPSEWLGRRNALGTESLSLPLRWRSNTHGKTIRPVAPAAWRIAPNA